MNKVNIQIRAMYNLQILTDHKCPVSRKDTWTYCFVSELCQSFVFQDYHPLSSKIITYALHFFSINVVLQ